MSLLDTASLIVTPNGYKEGKLYSVIPSDGSGDMSVTRATTATRVNSAGLVELVPYNLLNYSQKFDNAYWIKSSSNVTADNTTAPDGTTTADKMTITGGFGAVYVSSIPLEGTHTISCFFNKGNASSVYIDTNGTSGNIFGSLNLDTLATSSVGGAIVNVENAGNGWYRLSITASFTGTTSYIAFGILSASSNLFTYLWGAQLVEGSTAKDYQKTETRLNIPRLDYSNGNCPSLLVEPQRTNRLIYSEELVVGKAFAFASGTFSVTQNTTDTLDPFGNNNADKFTAVDQAANDSYTATSGSGNITLSVFAKKGTSNTLVIYHDNVTIPGFFWAQFNIQTGVVLATNGAVVSTSIEDYGNGWFRCSVTGPDTNATGNIHNFTTYAGTSYLFGVQLEQGNYLTSYIPTQGASVTRNADVISKTGISSLIGQTEGTIFIDTYIEDISAQTNDPVLIYVKGTSADVYIEIADTGHILGVFFDGSVVQGFIYVNVNLTNGRHKFAFGYKDNDFTLFLDGTEVGVDTSGIVSGSLTEFGLQYHDNFYRGTQSVNAAALWKTRLTNTQLAQLTTI